MQTKRLPLVYTEQTGLPIFNVVYFGIEGGNQTFRCSVVKINWSKVQTARDKKVCFGLRKPVGLLISCSELLKIWENKETPFLPLPSM